MNPYSFNTFAKIDFVWAGLVSAHDMAGNHEGCHFIRIKKYPKVLLIETAS